MGTDDDTAAFTVNTIRSWWNTTGHTTQPGANLLLITTDGGGSDGYRNRLWKTEFAALVAERDWKSPSVTCPRAPASGTRSSTSSSPTFP